MKTESLKATNWDDIIFENRNRGYGAYTLRKIYWRRVATGLGITILAVGLALAYPKIAELFEEEQQDEEPVLQTIKYTDLAPPPPIDKNIPPPPKLDVPPPVKTVIKFLPPKVTDKEVVEEEEMPTQEEIKQNDVGAENIEGAADITFEEPVAQVTQPEEDVIFTVVEQQPEFEGGYAEMMKFLKKNIRYPAKAQRMNIEGTVYVGFIVDNHGNISAVDIIKSLDPDCDKEAMRVVKLMPPWKPGKQNGKAVKVKFVLPIKFRLNS